MTAHDASTKDTSGTRAPDLEGRDDLSRVIGLLSRALVPHVADACTVIVPGSGGARARVFAHASEAWLLDLVRPPLDGASRLDEVGPIGRVLAGGPAEHRRFVQWGTIVGSPRRDEPTLASVLILPLSSEHGHVGAVALVRAHEEFREGDEPFIRAQLALGAAALGNARVLDEQLRAYERIARLQVFTEALATMLTTSRVAELAVEHGTDALGACAGQLMLLDRTGRTLQPVAAFGPSAVAGSRRDADLLIASQALAESVSAQTPIFVETTEECVSRDGKEAASPMCSRGARLALPLVARGRVIGGVAFAFEGDVSFSRTDREFALAFAHHCSLSLERCLAFKEQSAARARTASLQRVTAALASARTLDEASATLVEEVVEAVGCPAAWLAVLSEDGSEASIVHEIGLAASNHRWRRFSTRESGPIRDAIVGRKPLLFSDELEFLRAYPEHSDGIQLSGLEAAAIVPIIGSDRVLAVLGLRFRAASSFDDDLRDFLRAIAAESAHAIERALLADAERDARENLTFLPEASRILSSSLDVETTLDHLAQLVVPRMADWCCVDLLGPGGDAQVQALVHRSPEKAALGRELRRRFPPSSDGPLARVLRTGRSEAWFDIPDDPPGATTSEHARGLRELGMRSCLIVPLMTGGVVFGAMTLAMGEGEWRFGPADFALAEEIAARAATAMANARKHQELLRAREEAERANRTKDEFLAMLGHELRNPLMPILTVVELVRLQGQHAHTKEWSVVERQGRHLLRLVDDLLDVARITRGKIKLRRRPVETSQLVGRALETASTEIEGRRHRVHVSVAPNDLVVDGDEDRLVQVLANLLNNAARYTEPGGLIEVSAEDSGAWIVVRVRDTGVGLNSSLLPRVFDSFVQGPRALDRSQGGLGLGLAIVKNIVELHGGEVGVTSAGTGQGSEFSVRLPKADATGAAREAGDMTASSAPGRRSKRVLVVDDNVDAAETLADALRLSGHDVRVSYDGPSALASVASFKPSIALLDIGLPAMDGYELAHELKESLGNSVMLVAVTGYGQASDVERARAAGFHDHFTKPVDLGALCSLIDEAKVGARLLQSESVSPHGIG